MPSHLQLSDRQKDETIKKLPHILTISSLIFIFGLGSIGSAQTADRKGPLKDLPSEPIGDHLALISALGDNEWVHLGSPAPDPEWGKSRGRSWAPRMPYAPDMRGAFHTGEGPHGKVINGYGMDDVWFYDANQHRWICVYPGTPAIGDYRNVITIDKETGREVDKNGDPVPVAVGVHAYLQVTYDTDRKCFMRTTCGSYLGDKIKGRDQAQNEASEWEDKQKLEGDSGDDEPDTTNSPWIYDSVNHRWEIYRVNKPYRWKVTGYASTLVYVPSVQKAFAFRKRSYTFGWYNPATKQHEVISKNGDTPPWDMDPNNCYDSKRDRIYIGGGIYPKIEIGTSALYAFDVQPETFIHLQPTDDPGLQTYTSNNAMFMYDSVNDAAVLFMHDSSSSNGTGEGIYAYHPDENTWETVQLAPDFFTSSENPPYPHWSGFYDPALNVYFLFVGTDGGDAGTMWAYRYKQQP